MSQQIGDWISRQAVLDAIEAWWNNKTQDNDIYDIIKDLPSVNPQESTDTWSIKDIADALVKHGLIIEQESSGTIHGNTYGGVSWGGTYKPQEESKTGRWIKSISENGVTSATRCSECGFEDNRYMLFRYCPNCGTKMEKSEDNGEIDEQTNR